MGPRTRTRSARRTASRACSTARSTGTVSRGSSGSLFRELLHICLELVVLVLDGVEKQAFGEIRAALLLVHLADEVVDLLDHVLERPLELALGGDFPVEGFHHGEQIAVQGDGRAAGGFDGAHLMPRSS